ncbi:MAG: hypothetical protein JF599_03275 [Verrucomicrobia bacterium]|nr:hypothetical protein [Verrucomicrobiota bacterium]
MERRIKLGHPHWWQWLVILSLDAPLVALVWQALFARILYVDLPWHQPTLLGLAVWVIYVADRWIEGWLLKPESVQTQRHHFYIAWRWPVLGVSIAAVLLALTIAMTHLPSREWVASLILVLPTLAYLLSHQFVHRGHPLRVPKELCIASLFALGTVLAPAVFALPPELSFGHAVHVIGSARFSPIGLPLGLFGLLCLTNLVLISAWEKEVDVRHGQTSLALQLSSRRQFIHGLPWLLALLGLSTAMRSRGMVQMTELCVVMSALFLGVLDRFEYRIGRQAARALVDLTLLTPIAVLLLT